MSPLLLALLLAAAPPAQRAQQLAKTKAWEDLYLTYSAADPKGYPDEERKAIAGPLRKGCEALLASDAVMAYSLGERAVAFEESAGGLLCLARAAHRSDQRSSAEETLRKGLERFPKEGAFSLELGRLLLEEKDAQGAIAVLDKVPPRSPQGSEAKRLLQKARNMSAEASQARAEARQLERRLSGEGPTAGNTRPAVATGPGETQPTGLSFESGVGADGMRTRSNRLFVLKYFNNNRDFGQRAEYEGRIVEAMGEAYTHTRSILGEARESSVDVILYTREEYKTHVGASYARTTAGVYSDGSMRINDATELTQETRGVLVHEYVHAAVDDFCGGADHGLPTWLNEGLATYVEWRYFDSESPPLPLIDRLFTAAKSNRLPRLGALADGMLIRTADPALSYATSALAVRELYRRGGPARLLALIKEVGRGTPFEQALVTNYGIDLPKLDKEVLDAALSRR
jgi:hypothetical protein